MLFERRLSGSDGLPDVSLTTLAGHAVHTGSLKYQVVLQTPKKSGDPRGQAHRLSVLPEQQSAVVFECRAYVGGRQPRHAALGYGSLGSCSLSAWVLRFTMTALLVTK